jgi:hypothetical protein
MYWKFFFNISLYIPSNKKKAKITIMSKHYALTQSLKNSLKARQTSSSPWADITFVNNYAEFESALHYNNNNNNESKATTFDKSKIYIVCFYAKWCGPCKRHTPQLVDMVCSNDWKNLHQDCTVVMIESDVLERDEKVQNLMCSKDKFSIKAFPSVYLWHGVKKPLSISKSIKGFDKETGLLDSFSISEILRLCKVAVSNSNNNNNNNKSPSLSQSSHVPQSTSHQPSPPPPSVSLSQLPMDVNEMKQYHIVMFYDDHPMIALNAASLPTNQARMLMGEIQATKKSYAIKVVPVKGIDNSPIIFSLGKRYEGRMAVNFLNEILKTG